MIWGRRKREKSTIMPEDHLDEARAARLKAEIDLEVTRGKTKAYRELGDQLKQIRKKNNFRAAIEATFRGPE